MRRLGITQRVDVIPAYGERRDCLDQRWTELALRLGFIPVPLPNAAPALATTLIADLQLDALLLSGGNSISILDPEAADAAPERDHFEQALIDSALERHLPVLGVCRGMQMINLHLGGSLSRVKGHVAQRHPLQPSADFNKLISTEVNSYHNWGIGPGQLAAPLHPIATDQDGGTEAFTHRTARIAGIMWHPEREQPPHHTDLELLEQLLQ